MTKKPAVIVLFTLGFILLCIGSINIIFGQSKDLLKLPFSTIVGCFNFLASGFCFAIGWSINRQ